MNQYKCSESARQKCPDRSICGEGTYTGIDCECAKFNERCLPTKERNIIFELQQENAALKSERDELKRVLKKSAGCWEWRGKQEKEGTGKMTHCSDCENLWNDDPDGMVLTCAATGRKCFIDDLPLTVMQGCPKEKEVLDHAE